MKKIIMILILVVSTYSYSRDPQQISNDIQHLFTIVNKYQDIIVDGVVYQVDMERLLEMTAMVESRYGTNNYKGRIAKTEFQFELTTANHYVTIANELKGFLEEKLGRKISIDNDRDSVYIAYIIYMSKIRYHRDWLDKHKNIYEKSFDIEYLLYKVLWNSVLGKTTYSKWIDRQKEMVEIWL